MRVPLPLTETTLRLPQTGTRLPPLTVGQQLEVLVESRKPEGLLLNVLGRRVTVPSQLQVPNGERLTVQVQTLQPQVSLKILAATTRATETQAQLARLLPQQQGPVGHALAPVTRTVESPQAQSLPAPVRDVLGRLAQALPGRAEATDPATLRRVLEHSGLFLERLLSRVPVREAGQVANTDVKALLQRAAAALRQSLGRAVPTPQAQGGSSAPTQAAPNLVPVLEGLLTQVESALSRIQLLQLQPNISQSPLDLTVEVPLRDGADVDNLYLRIRKDGGGVEAEGDNAEPVYQLVVRLDFERFGTAQATLRMQGEKVSAVWHSENPSLSEAIQQHLPELESRIRGLGLEAESVLCVNAPPPRSTDDVRQPPSGIFHEQA
ncbi:flagellar hook-length control protein FliK [Ectothiorhodospiraceae bacterium WFHF3C12]|nr:flagellar hook-length control protein FliK [Ectothiorhodospiraceae bacterium WFHF3C12]